MIKMMINGIVLRQIATCKRTFPAMQTYLCPMFLRSYRGSRFRRIVTNLDTNVSQETGTFDPPMRRNEIEGKIDEEEGDLDNYLEFPSDTLRYWQKMRAEELSKKRNQSNKSFRPKINPGETTILLFPGQGSQFVGMGKNLLKYPKVEKMFNTAKKILGFDLLEICLKGPKDELDKTMHCQPAMMVTSLAAIEKLKSEKPWAIENCVTTAGYSVGELSALVFAGALTFEDALHLVKARSSAMQTASEMVPGRMMTVYISPDTKLKFACHAAKLFCTRELNIEEPICSISNFLHPGCKVIAGNSEAIEFIARNAKEFKIKRASFLPVSGAFHTNLMIPAARIVEKTLTSLQIDEPAIPVHSNVTGSNFKDSKDIKKLLVKQIYKPVMWEQIIHSIYARPQQEEFPRTFELGPGKQLGHVLKMVNAKAFQEYENVEV